MKVIGIGASAGGLEAITRLVSKLSDGSGAAFVFLQHLSPNTKSMIGELLGKHTSMPVTMVYKDQPVKANHIYVMAENKNIVFSNGRLLTKARPPESEINLPIDQFFNSLGESLGSHAVGVLLSGTGTDGTRGLRTIKEKGGFVLVQSPETAKFDGMPRAAIDLKIADRISPPEELAQDIEYILTHRDFKTREVGFQDKKQKETYFDKIVQLVSKRTHVDFSEYREPTLSRRLENRILIRKCNDIQAYWEIIQQDVTEVAALFSNFLIGVTNFFRDPEAYDAIRKEVLPEIFSQPKAEGAPYRFWVTACSTGEEAYTLAMLIEDYLQEHDRENVDYKVFASDIDEHAIQFAIKGTYSLNMVADVPEPYQSKYFIREGDYMQVRPSLRKRIMFAVQNLLGDPPFINMDLITCRNLLIYLRPEVQQKALSTLHFALKPGAFLFLGPSESLGSLKYAFEKYTRSWNIFTKRADKSPKLQSSFSMHIKPANTEKSKQNMSSFQSDLHPSFTDTDPFTRFLVERFAPIAFFVTEELDILYLNGEAEQILNMPRALARLNLSKMLSKEDLLTFKAGIQQVLSEGGPISFEHVVLRKRDREFIAEVRFDLPHLPELYEKGENESTPKVILIEVYLPEESKEEDEPAPKNMTEGKVTTLQKQLKASKRRSQELVNELEATNEELQTSNRELMASNEELQSTNEELQSVNEELYTVNSELQMKNEELTTANNDISNLLKSTDIGTIFLDKGLKIRRFTPAVRRQFNLIDSDVGRSITNFATTFKGLDIEEVCQEVFRALSPFEKEIVDKEGDHYLLRVLPYRTEEDYIDGLVLTFVNINELAISRNQTQKAERIFKQFVSQSDQQIAIIDKKGKVHFVNRVRFTGKKSDDLIGQPIYSYLPEDIRDEVKKMLENVFDGKPFERLQFSYDYQGGSKGDASLIIVPIILEGYIKYAALIEDID
ncbi:chemotaxis protein CheB [Phaeodactylibacter xiamenensis]|uniref:chemotaxis protein CheB n=1 Tax=Phaeodactylibacter xiamenensis TaxID=1524460 RepID=UPI003CCC4300